MLNINHNISNLAFKLNPYFITGLTEAEGSFSLGFHKNNKAKFKFSVGLRYKITMLENEVELLKMVQSFFDCGVLSQNRDGTVDFLVRDFSSISNIIIPHFLKYPLRGTKYLDFISFKEAFNIFDSREHLTEEGINKLNFISKNMNTYRKFPINDYYRPSHTIEDNLHYLPLKGHYINGFIAGDGCLALNLKDKGFARMSLQITQHVHNKLLLRSIANYFESPLKIYPHSPNSLQITLSGIKLWENIIFKHFSNYPLYGSKKLRLNKLFFIRELILDNKHLMQVGRYRQWKPEYKLRIKDIWKS